MLTVGSPTKGVRGSSEGTSAKAPLPVPEPVTKPWLLISVPSSAPASTSTSNTMVATLFGVAETSARIAPGVAFSGAFTCMPACKGEMPAASGRATPLSVVLPAT